MTTGTTTVRPGAPGGAGPSRPAADGLPTPAVRRLARHLGIDLTTVVGTGPGDCVTRGDVKAAARRPTVTAAPAGTAALMARAGREIPHYYVAVDLDLRRADDWLAAENAARAPGTRILRSALLMRAVARAAREQPEMNGTWRAGAFVPARAVHVAVTLAGTVGAATPPVLAQADTMTVTRCSDALRALVARTRLGLGDADGVVGTVRAGADDRPDQHADERATITVHSLGARGVDRMFGVITPPQVAVVSVGRVTPQACACDGTLRIHPRVTITLAGDHRVSDGAAGSRFLGRVATLLQDPARL
jgi:pyruvate dehydrogenase E2 component (dihydrolipoamide acetyltransferase)